MRVYQKIIICLFLIASATFALFSCGSKDDGTDVGATDIIISEESGYSDATLERAERIIYDMVLYYSEKLSPTKLPDTAVEKIEKISSDVCSVLADIPLAEESFIDVIELFESSGRALIDEISSEDGKKDSLIGFYLDMCWLVGYDYIGVAVYRLFAYSLDYQYEKRMDEYQKYGFGYLLDEANTLSADKLILTSEIKEEKFLKLLRGALSVASLWCGDGLEAENVSRFTDEELLTFIKKIDLSIELSDEGWGIVLRRLAPRLSSGEAADFVDAALKNGDAEEITAVMNSFSRLLSSVQQSLTIDSIKYLRSGEGEQLISRIFELFGDDEWQLFAEITSVSLNSSDYEKICGEMYGDDFKKYKDGLVTVTLDGLKDSVGKDKFYESLEGYVGGISPALSYGMRR